MTDPGPPSGNRSGDATATASSGEQARSQAALTPSMQMSGAIDRLGTYGTQAVQEGIVIRQELLAELRDHQSALECYVTGYMESYPEVSLVKQARSLLEEERDKPEGAGQYNSQFWRGLRDRLEGVEPLSTRLNSLLQYDDVRLHLESFDKNLIVARDQIQRVLRSYKGIDLNGIAFELDQTIANMLEAISRITEVCRKNTDSKLENLKSTINRIFERIKVEEERKQRAEAQRQPEVWGKAAPESLSSARPGAASPSSDASTRSRG